jgi:hypothetical protein
VRSGARLTSATRDELTERAPVHLESDRRPLNAASGCEAAPKARLPLRTTGSCAQAPDRWTRRTRVRRRGALSGCPPSYVALARGTAGLRRNASRTAPPPTATWNLCLRFNGRMQSGRFSPCAELRELFLPAYAPCTHFCGACKGAARWDPGKGHVPRGFVGALGLLQELELVLVAAEPGNPLPGEQYEGADPGDYLDQCAEKAYRIFDQRRDQYHRNIRGILDACFPDLAFSHQMRRTWITSLVRRDAALSHDGRGPPAFAASGHVCLCARRWPADPRALVRS